MNNSTRVVFNTGVLYTKMLVTVIIGLWSTKLLLSALGESDYGVFNLVGGVIGMLSFLNVSMTTASQRFMSYNLGKGGAEIASVVKCSIKLHWWVAIVVVVILEIAYPFLFGGFLNINEESLYGAKCIYQFMLISTFATITAVPYDAMINAHEDMVVFAVVNFIEAVLKFLIALLLLYVLKEKADLLVWYGLLFALVTINSTFIKRLYCKRKYDECLSLHKVILNVAQLKNMLAFAGWSLYGTMCGIFRNQGVAIILNLFWGTTVNAAYGIANQINAQVSFFATSLMKAFNPQIMKSEGANNRSRMLEISMTSSKFSFMILAFLFIPLVLNIDNVLKFWLKDVPQYTSGLCSLILMVTLALQLTIGIQSAMQAINKVKVYNIIVGSTNLMVPLLGYVVYKLGLLNVYYILVIALVIECIDCLIRVLFLAHYTELKTVRYFIDVIIPCMGSVFVTYFLAKYAILYLDASPIYIFLLSTAITSLLLSLCVMTFVANTYEKKIIRDIIKNILYKLRNKIKVRCSYLK